MEAACRVLIVDAEDLFRRGLAVTFGKDPGVEAVGQARTGEEAISLARELRPHAVLTELNLQDMSGLDVARRILREQPDMRIALIARSFSRANIVEAAKAGVHGYLTKDITLATLVDAVKRVAEGEVYISPGASQLAIEELASGNGERSSAAATRRGDRSKVTDREREVLELIVHGATNRDIAGRLLITENTVKVHLRNILDKLHLRNRQQAAAFAVSSGLVELRQNDGRQPNGDDGPRSTPTTWRQRSG